MLIVESISVSVWLHHLEEKHLDYISVITTINVQFH